MNKNLKLNILVRFMSVLEVLYLLTFAFILYARLFPGTEAMYGFIDIWLKVSYMIVPVLLFKNILVAILRDGDLSKKDRIWILVRSALYVLLAIYSYPLIAVL